MFKLDSLGLHDINSKCARFATIARSRGLGFFFLTTSTYPGGGDDGIRGGESRSEREILYDVRYTRVRTNTTSIHLEYTFNLLQLVGLGVDDRHHPRRSGFQLFEERATGEYLRFDGQNGATSLGGHLARGQMVGLDFLPQWLVYEGGGRGDVRNGCWARKGRRGVAVESHEETLFARMRRGCKGGGRPWDGRRGATGARGQDADGGESWTETLVTE